MQIYIDRFNDIAVKIGTRLYYLDDSKQKRLIEQDFEYMQSVNLRLKFLGYPDQIKHKSEIIAFLDKLEAYLDRNKA